MTPCQPSPSVLITGILPMSSPCARNFFTRRDPPRHPSTCRTVFSTHLSLPLLVTFLPGTPVLLSQFPSDASSSPPSMTWPSPVCVVLKPSSETDSFGHTCDETLPHGAGCAWPVKHPKYRLISALHFKPFPIRTCHFPTFTWTLRGRCHPQEATPIS